MDNLLLRMPSDFRFLVCFCNNFHEHGLALTIGPHDNVVKGQRDIDQSDENTDAI